MNPLKLILAFSPWISLWIIAWGHSLFRLQLAIVIAALLVAVMAITRLHRGVILWAGVLFFSAALVGVVWLKNLWFIAHMTVLAHGTLCLFTWLSILTRRPFTLDYARQNTPKELWDHPVLVRTCYVVAIVWGVVFALNALFGIYLLRHEIHNEWLHRGVELGLMAFAIVFTSSYTGRAKHLRDAIPT